MSSLSLDEKQKMVGTLCEQYLQKIMAKLKNNRTSVDLLDVEEPFNMYNAEMVLWSQLKKYIESHEMNLITCIHGFYVYLLQVTYSWIKGPIMDMYFIKFNNSNHDVSVAEDVNLLLYNIYIRLGDLNRYLKNLKMARCYYHQAQEVNPYRGHAYNQLALVSTTEIFKSIYYSVRAFMAIEEPIPMAENNIKSAVNRCSLINPNLDPLFTDCTSEIDVNRIENWLHFVSIAIYCDKLRIVFPGLTKEINKILQSEAAKSSDKPLMPKSDPKWIFSALDVAIDIVLTRQSDEKLAPIDLEKELSECKNGLTVLMKEKKYINDKSEVALKHDYLLCGFSPLKDSHSQLNLSADPPNDHENMLLLLLRLSEKLDKLINFLADKRAKSRAKKTRNIALQSILGSKGSS